MRLPTRLTVQQAHWRRGTALRSLRRFPEATMAFHEAWRLTDGGPPRLRNPHIGYCSLAEEERVAQKVPASAHTLHGSNGFARREKVRSAGPCLQSPIGDRKHKDALWPTCKPDQHAAEQCITPRLCRRCR